MKKLGLYLMTILMVCVSCIFVACGKNKNPDTITLSETAITLEVGASKTLTATTNVEAGAQWSTSDDTVATVDGGVVTAIAAGTATITATAGEAKATCTVTVTEASYYAELTVDKTTVELKEGGASVSVKATFTVNDEAQDATFVWSTENASVATVANGSIIPVGVGSTIVTVSVEYKGETYAADVNVQVKPDEQIQVSKGTMALALVAINGDITSDTFTATAYKAGVENTNVTLTYVSSNENVATVSVNAGVATVTSVGEGTCTISVSYTSAQGKIETLVTVTVTRSVIDLDQVIEIPYVEGNTALDISGLDVQGTFESVYAEGEQVASANGVLDAAFVEKNKGVIVPVEVRTSAAIYEVELLIAVPYAPTPKQEIATKELVDMPTFNGDAASLGFSADTETVYELVVDTENGKDGWSSRMIINAANDKDVVVFDVIIKEGTLSNFTVWPAMNTLDTQGSYGVYPKTVDPSQNADWDRKIFTLGTDGKQPASFTAGNVYTVYVFLNKGESHVHFSTFTDSTVYVANIRCIDAEEVEKDPTIIPVISQGEDRNEMPIFNGDVTALGFTAGTVVYEIAGAQSNTNDVKLVAQVDATGDNAYAKLDFVLSAKTNSLGLWITAANSHLGYYTVTPTNFTTDGLGDPNREIVVTDANGNFVESFDANTMYTLYVRLDGREATIQLTTWAALTIYAANFACITEEEIPFDSTLPPVVQGESISILFIGNSFSDDTEAYMMDILLNLGYTNIDIGNLYIGGCDIDLHYENILNGTRAYDFRMRSHNGVKYTEYETTSVGGKKNSLPYAIAYKDWDIISVQQASGYSGQADSYANLDALVNEVKKLATNPNVEFVFNMTWAYQANSTHAQFPDYNSDQMTMYNAIVNATQAKVTYTVVPNGTAIQNARTSYIGDNLTRDGYHLDLKLGRFIAGLTFVAKVTGADISDFDYIPNGITKTQFKVAIESVQNAIETPFAITESTMNVDPTVPADSLVQPGASNKEAVSVYGGSATELGFAEGTTVYQYVGRDATTDKVAILVDSANYDYVEVEFVIASGDGYFFLYGVKGGSYYNGGVSYIIDPSNLRIATGGNPDRRIEVLDAEGTRVTTLMSTGMVYTLRVFTKLGELDEIRIDKSNSTIYFANVTYGLESDLPIEGPINQGSGAGVLPTYMGDVTALGFEAGSLVQYMVTETMDNGWGTQSNGKTREQLAARISGQEGKYVTVQFATSEDIASGSVFYVWGLLGNSHTQNGGVNFNATTYGRILDLEGYPVTSIAKNTVYVLELYIAGTDTYKVANIVAAGMELYFNADSITCSDESIAVQMPGSDSLISAGGSNANAVTIYNDDETALGFAAGSTVYQYVGANSVTDKVSIKVDSANYDYVEVEFVIGSGASYFMMWGLKGGNYHNSGASYVIDPSWIRIADGNNTPSDRRIEVYDADGNKVTSSMETGKLYTLRVYTKLGELDEIRIGKDGSTIYFANVAYGSDSNTPDPNPTPNPDTAPIESAETTSTALTVYTGDATQYGFANGTTVYQLASGERSWDDRVVIEVNPANYYVDIEFVVVSGAWYFNMWVVNAGGMLDGNYIVNENVGGFAPHYVNTGANGGNTKIQVLDMEGNVVIGARTLGTRYILRVYLANENLTKVQLGQANTTILLANVKQGPESDLAEPIRQGDGATVLPTYTDDVTALGFAEGDFVQYIATETLTGGWWEQTSVDSNGKTREQLAARIPGKVGKYVTIQFITSEDIASGSVFYVWGLAGTGYVTNGNGGVNFTTTNLGRILDLDGNPVTSISKNTVYVLELYIATADMYKVANICETGMELYFATNTLAYADSSMAPELPAADSLITAGGSNINAVTVYKDDVTALGFAAGTTVYQYVGVDSSADKVAVKVNSADYDYVDVQFVIASGDGYFFLFGLKGGNYYNYGVSYVIDPSWIRLGDGNNTPSDRRIEVYDADGNKVTSSMETGKLYTLRVYTKLGELDEIRIGQRNSTIYFAKVEQGIDTTPVAVEIKQGDDRVAMGTYPLDSDSLGFAPNTEVFVMDFSEETEDISWELRAIMNVDSSKNCLKFEFRMDYELYGDILIWTSNAGQNPDVDAPVAIINQDGGLAADSSIVVVIEDADGNDVTDEVLSGETIYTVYIYYNGAGEVHIGTTDTESAHYFANAECINK